jgi:amino acid transporter
LAEGKSVGAPARKITLVGLIAATYFMVAGGPYGLEDVVQEAGYLGAAALILIIPILWSLPTALMVSELSSALPEEGGYYVWVRKALGPFWGFQEAWLSLAASAFDMAIYPLFFVTYLGFVGECFGDDSFWHGLTQTDKGTVGLVMGATMIAVCALANLRTPRSLGRSAVFLTVAMLAPFVVLSVRAATQTPVAPEGVEPKGIGGDWVVALLFALFNYMGWDNASTVAGEVERPQRTYPLAMAGAVMLVTLTYLIPVLAVSRSGLSAGSWESGYWVKVAEHVGWKWLAVALGIGGMIANFGTFNSLVLSYSRLPVVLAEDGYLPRIFQRRLRTGAPWVAILVCAVVWGLAMQLGLRRVLALDVILYGLSLLLEFAALVALRVRQPQLARPFQVPGGLAVAVGIGVFPALLIGLAIWNQAGQWTPKGDDPIAPAKALLLGAGLTVLGPLLYGLRCLAAGKPPVNERQP